MTFSLSKKTSTEISYTAVKATFTFQKTFCTQNLKLLLPITQNKKDPLWYHAMSIYAHSWYHQIAGKNTNITQIKRLLKVRQRPTDIKPKQKKILQFTMPPQSEGPQIVFEYSPHQHIFYGQTKIYYLIRKTFIPNRFQDRIGRVTIQLLTKKRLCLQVLSLCRQPDTQYHQVSKQHN